MLKFRMEVTRVSVPMHCKSQQNGLGPAVLPSQGSPGEIVVTITVDQDCDFAKAVDEVEAALEKIGLTSSAG